MTNQEAFDKMMAHLRSLPERSTYPRSAGMECAYNGTMCAVGVLMSEAEQLHFGASRGGVRALLREMQAAGYTSVLHALDVGLLVKMQGLHDEVYNWDSTGLTNEERASKIAELSGLVYTPPRTKEGET